MKRLAWLLAALAVLATGLYAALLAALWWGQEALLFHPATLPADHRFKLPADVHETWVEVPGARLNALHLKLPAPRGVVFYLHGNAGSLDTWFANADFYRRANIDLFMLDYRGYGKSTGRIESQAQLEADVRAAWAHVAPLYAGRQRVFFGRSLGTGLAAGLAAEVQPELTVLVSPYTSMEALAREHYPIVPTFLLRYPLRTDRAVTRLQGDLFIAHGTNDSLIAPAHAQALQALAPRSELLLVPGAGHNDIQLSPLYLQRLAQVLQTPHPTPAR